ncbi:MAG: TPM domain-containing protein, partial [Candidatus Eremiobacteraeota bacterium]|nr:TPM domain-containing protein [Candidatus Eremiobacteraeota bacterium]
MKRLLGALALVAIATLAGSPAQAATSFVQDGAGLFSADAIARVDAKLTAFNAQTHKEVVVITVKSLADGQDVGTAARAAFAAQNIDGTLIYIAYDNHKVYVQPDRSATQAGWITSSTSSSISNAIGAQFKAQNNDGALTTGVGQVLDIYRAHVGSLGRSSSTSANSSSSGSDGGGIHFQMWWLIVIVVGFFILRSLMRPRYYGPPGGVAPGAPGPGGMPMGGGYGGGGGGFWSGLLGGLGGAWLGNEMFRGGGGGGMLGGGGGSD